MLRTCWISWLPLRSAARVAPSQPGTAHGVSVVTRTATPASRDRRAQRATCPRESRMLHVIGSVHERGGRPVVLDALPEGISSRYKPVWLWEDAMSLRSRGPHHDTESMARA